MVVETGRSGVIAGHSALKTRYARA